MLNKMQAEIDSLRTTNATSAGGGESAAAAATAAGQAAGKGGAKENAALRTEIARLRKQVTELTRQVEAYESGSVTGGGGGAGSSSAGQGSGKKRRGLSAGSAAEAGAEGTSAATSDPTAAAATAIMAGTAVGRIDYDELYIAYEDSANRLNVVESEHSRDASLLRQVHHMIRSRTALASHLPKPLVEQIALAVGATGTTPVPSIGGSFSRTPSPGDGDEDAMLGLDDSGAGMGAGGGAGGVGGPPLIPYAPAMVGAASGMGGGDQMMMLPQFAGAEAGSASQGAKPSPRTGKGKGKKGTSSSAAGGGSAAGSGASAAAAMVPSLAFRHSPAGSAPGMGMGIGGLMQQQQYPYGYGLGMGGMQGMGTARSGLTMAMGMGRQGFGSALSLGGMETPGVGMGADVGGTLARPRAQYPSGASAGNAGLVPQMSIPLPLQQQQQPVVMPTADAAAIAGYNSVLFTATKDICAFANEQWTPLDKHSTANVRAYGRQSDLPIFSFKIEAIVTDVAPDVMARACCLAHVHYGVAVAISGEAGHDDDNGGGGGDGGETRRSSSKSRDHTGTRTSKASSSSASRQSESSPYLYLEVLEELDPNSCVAYRRDRISLGRPPTPPARPHATRGATTTAAANKTVWLQRDLCYAVRKWEGAMVREVEAIMAPQTTQLPPPTAFNVETAAATPVQAESTAPATEGAETAAAEGDQPAGGASAPAATATTSASTTAADAATAPAPTSSTPASPSPATAKPARQAPEDERLWLGVVRSVSHPARPGSPGLVRAEVYEGWVVKALPEGRRAQGNAEKDFTGSGTGETGQDVNVEVKVKAEGEGGKASPQMSAPGEGNAPGAASTDVQMLTGAEVDAASEVTASAPSAPAVAVTQPTAVAAEYTGPDGEEAKPATGPAFPADPAAAPSSVAPVPSPAASSAASVTAGKAPSAIQTSPIDAPAGTPPAPSQVSIAQAGTSGQRSFTSPTPVTSAPAASSSVVTSPSKYGTRSSKRQQQQQPSASSSPASTAAAEPASAPPASAEAAASLPFVTTRERMIGGEEVDRATATEPAAAAPSTEPAPEAAEVAAPPPPSAAAVSTPTEEDEAAAAAAAWRAKHMPTAADQPHGEPPESAAAAAALTHAAQSDVGASSYPKGCIFVLVGQIDNKQTSLSETAVDAMLASLVHTAQRMIDVGRSITNGEELPGQPSSAPAPSTAPDLLGSPVMSGAGGPGSAQPGQLMPLPPSMGGMLQHGAGGLATYPGAAAGGSAAFVRPGPAGSVTGMEMMSGYGSAPYHYPMLPTPGGYEGGMGAGLAPSIPPAGAAGMSGTGPSPGVEDMTMGGLDASGGSGGGGFTSRSAAFGMHGHGYAPVPPLPPYPLSGPGGLYITPSTSPNLGEQQRQHAIMQYGYQLQPQMHGSPGLGPSYGYSAEYGHGAYGTASGARSSRRGSMSTVTGGGALGPPASEKGIPGKASLRRGSGEHEVDIEGSDVTMSLGHLAEVTGRQMSMPSNGGTGASGSSSSSGGPRGGAAHSGVPAVGGAGGGGMLRSRSMDGAELAHLNGGGDHDISMLGAIGMLERASSRLAEQRPPAEASSSELDQQMAHGDSSATGGASGAARDGDNSGPAAPDAGAGTGAVSADDAAAADAAEKEAIAVASLSPRSGATGASGLDVLVEISTATAAAADQQLQAGRAKASSAEM